MRKLYATIVFLFLSLIFFSCSSSSGPSGVTVKGKAFLSGQIDHSGINIQIYQPVKLDTAIQRLNKQFPGIGVEISQSTEFEYWNETPINSTVTNGNGNWEISGLTQSEYHIVAGKNGYSYCHRLSQATGNDVVLDSLKESVTLNGVLSKNSTLTNVSLYIDNLTVPSGLTLSISGHSDIFFSKNGKITVYGTLIITGSDNYYIKITNLEGATWDKIELDATANATIQYAVFENALLGIYNQSENISITSCVFRTNCTGMQNFSVSNSITTDKILFAKNRTGYSNNNINYGIFEQNLYFKNKNGLEIASVLSLIIQNNVFFGDSSYALDIHPAGGIYTLSAGLIGNNHFENAISSIFLGPTSRLRGTSNNFINIDDYFVYSRTMQSITDTLDFTHNYWGFFDEISIHNKIYDSHDTPDQKGGIINVKNFSYNPFSITN